MTISPLQSHPHDSSLALEKVAANPQLTEAEKVGEASRQFEAIFLRQILAAAQKPAFPSRFNPQSFSSGIYQDMMTNQLADEMSRSGGFGLAARLQGQLTQRLDGASDQQSTASNHAARVPAPQYAQKS